MKDDSPRPWTADGGDQKDPHRPDDDNEPQSLRSALLPLLDVWEAEARERERLRPAQPRLWDGAP